MFTYKLLLEKKAFKMDHRSNFLVGPPQRLPLPRQRQRQQGRQQLLLQFPPRRQLRVSI